jgi:hypothetical protein
VHVAPRQLLHQLARRLGQHLWRGRWLVGRGGGRGDQWLWRKLGKTHGRGWWPTAIHKRLCTHNRIHLCVHAHLQNCAHAHTHTHTHTH